MSIRQIVRVWEHEFAHFEQAVMLALADHADDDGKNIRPSVAHIAWKTGYKPRRVQEILKGLREDRAILVLVTEGGGRGHPNEYEFDWSKATQKRPWDDVRDELAGRKGANNAPFAGGERVHSKVETVHSGGERVHSGVETVRPGAPEPSEPSDNRQEPGQQAHDELAEGPVPDDITSRCLLLLKKVKGMTRDYGSLALLLGELRAEFPGADPVAACRDYEFKHRHGMSTKNHPNRLRHFFRTSHERHARNGSGGSPAGEARNGKGVGHGTSRQDPSGEAGEGKYGFLLD